MMYENHMFLFSTKIFEDNLIMILEVTILCFFIVESGGEILLMGDLTSGKERKGLDLDPRHFM